jgi:hypothetical protein
MKTYSQMPAPAQAPQPLSPDTQAMLDSLQLAVTKMLERKRRLGHYVVQWSGNAPVFVGEDAPVAAGSGEADAKNSAI